MSEQIVIKNQSTFTLIGIALIASVAGFFFGSCSKETDDQQTIEYLMESVPEVHTEIKEVKVQDETLVNAIKELSDENTQLLDLVRRLKDKPAEVRYVVQTETKIEPANPKEIFDELPNNYQHKTKEGLVLAEFNVLEPVPELSVISEGLGIDHDPTKYSFSFETYDLTIKNSVVIGKDSATSLLQVASAKEPDKFYEIPITDLTVINTEEEHKKLEANVGISLTGGLSAKPEFMASVFASFIHPVKNLDVLGVRLSGNTTNFVFGVDAVGYNIGAHIPVFTDLWIHGGAGVDLFGKPVGLISLGTKF